METEFLLHASFIEILKEEVRDLLDNSPVKQPIQIRETSTGVITLAGSTEVGVHTLIEMASCLEQGSLNRATGSTNMNNQSSRSHTIFTITLEQMHRPDGSVNKYVNGDFYVRSSIWLILLDQNELKGQVQMVFVSRKEFTLTGDFLHWVM